jgi:predicted TIM-barrel fold metal-dependent hydrolase
MADVEQILRLKIRMIKIHPPHQLLFPNDYLRGVKELEIIYRAAEANGIPVMFHTGTSIFPGARNTYGDPIYVDDVAVDFSHDEALAGAWRTSAVDAHCVLPLAAPS